MVNTAEQARVVRLSILLVALCVFHVFDLFLTQSQLSRPGFIELNALARLFMSVAPFGSESSTFGIAAYKAVLLGPGLAILWAVRRQWQAECGAWFVLAVSAGVIIWWVCYLDAVEVCLSDPAYHETPPSF